MSETPNSNEGPRRTSIRDAMKEKAGPIEIVAISIFIPAFLTLVIVTQQFSDNWFVKTYLSGFGFGVVVVLLFGLMLGATSLFERIRKRKSKDKQGSIRG